MPSLPLPLLLGVLFLGNELALQTVRRAGARGDRRQDRGTLRVLWATILLAVWGSGRLAAATPALAVDLPAWGAATAAALVVGGLAFRWRAVRALGRLFTVQVAIRHDHALVVTGPYARLRHPSYGGLLVAFAGLALSYEHLLALPAMLVPIAAAVVWRIRVEERALGAAFGPAWEAYARHTARLVPGLY